VDEKKREMSRFDSLNLAIAAIGAIVAVVGVVLGYLAYQSTWDIAELSGDLERPVVTLGLAGTRLKDRTNIVYGAQQLCDKENVVIGTIPFTMVNEGRTSVSDSTLTFRYDQRLKREALTALKPSIAGLANENDVRNLVSSDGNFDYAAYRHASLDPGVGLTIDEPMYLWNMDSNITETAVFKNGVSADLSFRIDYAVVFQATTNGRDTAAHNYGLNLHARCSASSDELLKHVVEQRIPDEAKKLRRDVGFLRYFGAVLLRRSEGQRRLFVVWQDLDASSDGEHVIFFSEKKPTVGTVDYNVLSWKEVF
jgi:hypothetical protein